MSRPLPDDLRPLDDIEHDAANATAGPWIHEPPRSQDGTIHHISSPGEVWPRHLMRMEDTGWTQPSSFQQRAADATFIANARTDVPALVARIRELEADHSVHLTFPDADSMNEWLTKHAKTDTALAALDRVRAALDAGIDTFNPVHVAVTAALDGDT